MKFCLGGLPAGINLPLWAKRHIICLGSVDGNGGAQGGVAFPVCAEIIDVPEGTGVRSITGLTEESLNQACHLAIAWAHRHLKLFARWMGFDEGEVPEGLLRGDMDVTIKFPSIGFYKKSGSSAGAAVAAALLGGWFEEPDDPILLEGVAVTGELNLRGEILPVADVAVKIEAAWKAGCNRVRNKRSIVPGDRILSWMLAGGGA